MEVSMYYYVYANYLLLSMIHVQFTCRKPNTRFIFLAFSAVSEFHFSLKIKRLMVILIFKYDLSGELNVYNNLEI